MFFSATECGVVDGLSFEAVFLFSCRTTTVVLPLSLLSSSGGTFLVDIAPTYFLQYLLCLGCASDARLPHAHTAPPHV
jgi:hypothetical protein